MNRYVVKNCPLYTNVDPFENTCATLYTCESDMKCLIKQAIEKLQSRACPGIDCDTCVGAECNIKVSDLAKEILDMFEIEVIKDAE